MAVPALALGLSAATKLLSGIASQGDPKDVLKTKTEKAAKDFETMYLENMLEPMFSSLGDNGPLGENGTGGSVYRSMMVKELATSIEKSGGVGIGASVYQEMLKMQESANQG